MTAKYDYEKELSKEILRVQKWLNRYEARMKLLQETYLRTQKKPLKSLKIEQLTFFGT